MTQSNVATTADLRELRTRFLEKQLAYALSFSYSLPCFRRGPPVAEWVRLKMQAGPTERRSPENTSIDPLTGDLTKDAVGLASVGRVFHVLGGDRVPGLDNLGRDVPTEFTIGAADESVVLRGRPASAGTIDGRMMLESPREKADAEPLRIAVTYGGTLQLSETVEFGAHTEAAPLEAVRASAFVIPFFETGHPKYHWLTENACIAFGTWELREGVVSASFDVYSAS